MKLERKHALVLIGIAVWNVVTYVTFIKNLAGTSGRPTGYYVAHTVLIVVNLLIAALLGTWGVRAYKAAQAERSGQGDRSVEVKA
ncbi:SCO4848 family membrane protein [Kribbella qitaiheensis]|uniref:SCO4848 family membrane protein n=1 Tax=Kribbella qitaiheensis TaxID=1544730 RepID=UPI0036061CFE